VSLFLSGWEIPSYRSLRGNKSTLRSPRATLLSYEFSFPQIWEFANKRTRNIFREHTNTIIDLDFSPDSRFLVSSSFDKTMRIWRMRDGFSTLLEDKSASFFYGVNFNRDGRYIAAGNSDGMVRMWNVRTSQLLEKWTAHGDIVYSAVFTADGKGLISSGRDHTWKYWDISELGND